MVKMEIQTVHLIETVRLFIDSWETRMYGTSNRDTPKILQTVRLIEQYA